MSQDWENYQARYREARALDTGLTRPARKPKAPAAASPKVKLASEMTAADFEEIARKNSFFGALGDSLEATLNGGVKVLALVCAVGAIGMVILWAWARLSG